MLPIEAIGASGILYCFFMYGTLRALRAKKAAHHQAKVKAEPVAIDMAAKRAKQTT
jgi:hypothetical protein